MYNFVGVSEIEGLPPGLHQDDKIKATLNNGSTFKAAACEIDWKDSGDFGVSRFEIISFSNELQDTVNKPAHYQLLTGVEVINVRDAILNKLPPNVPYNQVDSWSRSWEYLTRMWSKNGIEDAKKARWYLDRLIEQMEG